MSQNKIMGINDGKIRDIKSRRKVEFLASKKRFQCIEKRVLGKSLCCTGENTGMSGSPDVHAGRFNPGPNSVLSLAVETRAKPYFPRPQCPTRKTSQQCKGIVEHKL